MIRISLLDHHHQFGFIHSTSPEISLHNQLSKSSEEKGK